MQKLMRGEQPHIYHTDEFVALDEARMPRYTGIKEIDKENRIARLNAALDEMKEVDGMIEFPEDADQTRSIVTSNHDGISLDNTKGHVVIDHKIGKAGWVSFNYINEGYKKPPKHHLGHRGYTKPKHTRKKRVKPAKRK